MTTCRGSFRLLGLLALAAFAPACGDSGSGNDLIVTLADGKVQGDLSGGARLFLKIPFAKPPLGDLRWKAAVKNDPWTGIRHETDFAEGCPQDMSLQSSQSRNEDCLYLNVWSPEPAPRRAPVMVWFHGGGNFAGSAGDNVPLVSPPTKFYDGRYFATQHGIVVVTTNYRLGVLGFFPHQGLAAEGAPVGNQGLMDQHMVLQWVRDNIARFGGDPANVTIFGESAGSAAVCYHVASPLSRGLFQRAISESGGCTVPFGASADPTPSDPAVRAGLEMFAAASSLGCGNMDDVAQLACLRTKTVDQLMSAAPQPNLTMGTLPTSWVFTPVVDGTFLPAPARTYFDNHNIAKVHYMLGSNTDEGTLFLLSTSVPDYMASLQALYGMGCASKIAACYPAAQFSDAKAALARVIGDSRLVCPTRDTAVRAAAAGLATCLYNFNTAPSLIASLGLGATHGAEIAFVFHDDLQSASSGEKMIADAVSTYWAHFAAAGDPNGPDTPAPWPAFSPGGNGADVRLQIDAQWQILTDFRRKQCEFWAQVYQHPDCAGVNPPVCN